MLTGTGLMAAFLVGLLGAVHCAGMCGGVVSALGLSLPPAARQRPGLLLRYQLGYNLGRIASYTLMGALAGGLGAFAANLAAVRHAQLVLAVVAALFMLALGLYLGGWWAGLTRLERLGGLLWRRIEPLGRRLMPPRSPLHAIPLGAVWGWLPCGLVYSVLIWSLSAGSALRGAGLMLAFGLGTLPALLLMGVAAARLAAFTRRTLVRRVAGALVFGFGLAGLWRAWLAVA
ncbi:sulfite exporter TauE/SafE family protein [Thiohalobacter sp.]|uniref:sulfite exporter TauE/SafE family protein n=1 Tax=Thiohalobacter sp. TaxID=2025948 RepID=UPI00262F94A5|nr:sulfite exporter TauE/SafE family protein [Thiohalobacter sp.]